MRPRLATAATCDLHFTTNPTFQPSLRAISTHSLNFSCVSSQFFPTRYQYQNIKLTHSVTMAENSSNTPTDVTSVAVPEQTSVAPAKGKGKAVASDVQDDVKMDDDDDDEEDDDEVSLAQLPRPSRRVQLACSFMTQAVY